MAGEGVIITGGGHGGAQAALALRQNGFKGSILMIERKPDLPYERPPLIKEYLAREKPFERLLPRPASAWEDKQIAFRLRGGELPGVHAVRTLADVDRLMVEIDAGAKRAVVVGGGYIGLEAAAVLIKLGLSVTLLEALIALDWVNAIKDYAQGRKPVENRSMPRAEQLADTAVPLKELIGATPA